MKSMLASIHAYEPLVNPSADRIALARGVSSFIDLTDPSVALDSAKVVGRSEARLRSIAKAILVFCVDLDITEKKSSRY